MAVRFTGPREEGLNKRVVHPEGARNCCLKKVERKRQQYFKPLNATQVKTEALDERYEALTGKGKDVIISLTSLLRSNPQQFFHLFPALACHLFISVGVVQGQAVAAFFHAVYCFLAGGVKPLFQGVLGHGCDDDHGDVLHVAGLHDLFQVDVKEVAPGLAAEVVV